MESTWTVPNMDSKLDLKGPSLAAAFEICAFYAQKGKINT